MRSACFGLIDRVALAGVLLIGSLLSSGLLAGLVEVSGYVQGELRWFPTEPLFQGQDSSFGSAAGQLEGYWSDASGAHALEGKLFYRHSSAEGGERTHGDLRELFYRYVGSRWQIEVGFNKVFWGVIESAHLVDIVNQTDNVEAVNGEAKLGQAMVLLGLEQGWGNLDLFILPGCRERVFASGSERYQFGNPVSGELIPFNQRETRWESSREERRIDLAARWAQYFGNFDIALSYFRGTNREPVPIATDGYWIAAGPDGSSVFVVRELAGYYEILEQFGLEMQYLVGDWALKLEGTHRGLRSGDYNAMGAGLEYTFSNLAPWGQDVGVILEYLWNDRGDVDTRPFAEPGLVGNDALSTLPGQYLSPFQDDVFAGIRFALNDLNSTHFVGGIIRDLASGTTLGTLEGSTRIGDAIRVDVNLYLYSNVARDSSFYFYRHDDLLEVSVSWHY